MKLVLFPHGGSQNRGCEAIVRTTVAMLGEKTENLLLYSSNPKTDQSVGLDQIVTVAPLLKAPPPKKIEHLFLRVQAKLQHESDPDHLLLYRQHNVFRGSDVALSIGGDNYCYPGMIHVLKSQCLAIDHFKVPRILWGCSFDETLLTPDLVDHLKKYRAIFVRETVSQQILANAGVTGNVFLYPDPAFTLPRQDTSFQIQNGKPFIGINVSPLMNRFGSTELLLKNYEHLITEILEKTDRNVALIPHVFQEGNSDLDFMRPISEHFSKDRVELIDQEYNCMQLKSLISQCEFFVGCRTHATIAAYSTGVPTLVVGYSNKSKGIARDLFGREGGYVLPITDLKTETDLTDAFEPLYEKKDEIRSNLETKMKTYIPAAKAAGEKLKELLKRI